MKSEHLPLLNSVSAPAVHPDGSRAVVSVIRPDFDADAYVGQLWTVPLDPDLSNPNRNNPNSKNPDQRPRRLTRGFRDTAPDFSPDGRALAFLRAPAGGKPQLHVVEAAGGEPQLLTAAPLGVSSFAWSPDSRSIVFSARTPDEGRYGRIDGVGAGSEDARLITDFQYRMNGLGYTADKPLQRREILGDKDAGDIYTVAQNDHLQHRDIGRDTHLDYRIAPAHRIRSGRQYFDFGLRICGGTKARKCEHTKRKARG